MINKRQNNKKIKNKIKKWQAKKSNFLQKKNKIRKY